MVAALRPDLCFHTNRVVHIFGVEFIHRVNLDAVVPAVNPHRVVAVDVHHAVVPVAERRHTYGVVYVNILHRLVNLLAVFAAQHAQGNARDNRNR